MEDVLRLQLSLDIYDNTAFSLKMEKHIAVGSIGQMAHHVISAGHLAVFNHLLNFLGLLPVGNQPLPDV